MSGRFIGYRRALLVKDLSAGKSMWKVAWLQLSDSREVLTRGFGEPTIGLTGL